MLDTKHAQQFEPLLGELSPENLTCDGELTRREVAKRRNAIMKRWAALEKKLGCKASETDVYKALGWI